MAVENKLDAKLHGHLDNSKQDKFTHENYRNRHGTKKIKSSFGASENKVPRDHDWSFEPALAPKSHNIIDR
jgi:putative transposase